jgi:hypothetical protein
LYPSPNIIDVIRPRRIWLADIAYMGQMRNLHKLLVGKPERKRPCGRSRYRWEDNIRMNFIEIGWKVMNLIHLTQDREQ